MLTRIAVAEIDGYRHTISPHKGFSCAYRVRAGGQSCSAFARDRVHEAGLFAALPDIRRRMQLCSDIARQNPPDEEKREGKRKKRKHTEELCSWTACDGGCAIIDGTSRGCMEGICSGSRPRSRSGGGATGGGDGCDSCSCLPDICGT